MNITPDEGGDTGYQTNLPTELVPSSTLSFTLIVSSSTTTVLWYSERYKWRDDAGREECRLTGYDDVWLLKESSFRRRRYPFITGLAYKWNLNQMEIISFKLKFKITNSNIWISLEMSYSYLEFVTELPQELPIISSFYIYIYIYTYISYLVFRVSSFVRSWKYVSWSLSVWQVEWRNTLRQTDQEPRSISLGTFLQLTHSNWKN
jgi:hypothetical protein